MRLGIDLERETSIFETWHMLEKFLHETPETTEYVYNKSKHLVEEVLCNVGPKLVYIKSKANTLAPPILLKL